jgi:predicted nucleic acid-binding protein
MRFQAVHDLLAPVIMQGLVARCWPVDLEMLYTARSAHELEDMIAERELAFPLVPITQADFDRAAEVMMLLARLGKHRSARLPDLLIAAVSERAGLVLLHYDADFDHIAGVTGQMTRWVAERG